MILASLAAAGTLSGLVSANGYGAVTYEVDSTGYGVLTRFSDHLYQTPSPTSDNTWDLLYDSYFGLRAEGFSGWLTQSNGQSVTDGTIAVDRSRGSLTITEYTIAPMTASQPAFVQVLRVRNDSAATVDDVSVFSLHNYHLGAESSTSGEALSDAGGVLTETGTSTGLTMVMTPVVTPTTIGCTNVWATVNAGSDLTSGCPTSGDDQVGGFQWKLGAIAPGAEVWVAVVDSFGGDATSWVAGRTPAALVDAEAADWTAWHGATPAGASTDEAATYRQMMAWLRMAQVREDGDANGQLVASLPYADGAFTHVWNIAWARDGAYAARALAEGGHPDEAAAALRFLSRKPGTYGSYLEIDSYDVSVCRYYGDGTEWSDEDTSGPNIELDDWGLYLWALAGASDAGADVAELVSAAGPGVADPLVAVIDETGLLTEDSSIWERHWNGNQKHFTYSSAWAVRGLRDYAELSRQSAYQTAADGIAAAIEARLVRDGALVGNLEESDAMDLAAVDAFGNGAVDLAIDASLTYWEPLRTAAGGYHRNDDGDSYDEQEWIFVDLRLADALFRTCHTDEAQALLDHVTGVATDNLGVLPELLDPNTGEVEGPAPMIGFGAGVYALALHARAETDCSTPADTGDTGIEEDSGVDSGSGDSGDDSGAVDDTGEPKDFYNDALGIEGCACGGTYRGGWMAVFIGVVAIGRRRRR